MIGTLITCPACGSVEFDVKDTAGDILLHCHQCTHKAVLKKAGVSKGSVSSVSKEKYMPGPKKDRKKKETKEGDVKFVTMSPTMTEPQRQLILAGFHVCKELRNIDEKGRAFYGTSLFLITEDFLSGVDINNLSKKTRDLLDEARKANIPKEEVSAEDVAPDVREADIEPEDN